MAKSRLYINAPTEESLEEIMKKIEPMNNVKVHKKNKPKPRVTLKQVDLDVPKSCILDEIRKANDENEVKIEKIIVLYEVQKSDWSDKMVVLAVDEDYYDEFYAKQEIKIGDGYAKIRQYKKSATQCFNCGQFGHRASINKELVCTNQHQCMNCASEEHNTIDCRHKGAPSCLNCRKEELSNDKHAANSKLCPIYTRELAKIANPRVQSA